MKLSSAFVSIDAYLARTLKLRTEKIKEPPLILFGEQFDFYSHWFLRLLASTMDQDGAPVQNAEIILEVNGPVYKVITPVKTAQQFTGNSGSLIFTYISHELGVKYTLTVRKDTSFPNVSLGTPSLTCA